MKATNIMWDVDNDEILELLNATEIEVIKRTLSIECEEDIDKDFLIEIAFSKLRHCPALLDELLGLPAEIEIPKDLEEEDIAEWLSDTFGYCHSGFEIIQ